MSDPAELPRPAEELPGPAEDAGEAELAPEPEPEPVRRPGPPTAAMLLIAVTVALLGAPFGLLWAVVAPEVPVRVTEAGPAYGVPQPEQLAAADGWFALLAVPFGVLAAAAVWLADRRRARGVPALLALTVGMVGAGLLAWWLGRQIGLADYRETLAAAQPGADLTRPADLAVAEAGWWPPHVLGVVLVPALAAAATYTLLAAWSRFPGLHPAAPGPLDLTGAEPDRPAGA